MGTKYLAIARTQVSSKILEIGKTLVRIKALKLVRLSADLRKVETTEVFFRYKSFNFFDITQIKDLIHIQY